MCIRKFDSAIVCLDKDASVKSIQIAQQIKSFIPVKIKILETDLKNLPPDKTKEFCNFDRTESTSLVYESTLLGQG